MSSLWLPTDPPGLPRAPRARQIFDARPHRNRPELGQPWITAERSTPEWDERIIATAVALGCPREDAEQARTWPAARASLLMVWYVVQEAARGNQAARRTVDRYRQAFENRRAQKVAEALAAVEQPADPAELQALMGLAP
jgi:hypothetical protein